MQFLEKKNNKISEFYSQTIYTTRKESNLSTFRYEYDPAGYMDGLNLYAAYFGVNGVDPDGLMTLDDLDGVGVEDDPTRFSKRSTDISTKWGYFASIGLFDVWYTHNHLKKGFDKARNWADFPEGSSYFINGKKSYLARNAAFAKNAEYTLNNRANQLGVTRKELNQRWIDFHNNLRKSKLRMKAEELRVQKALDKLMRENIIKNYKFRVLTEHDLVEMGLNMISTAATVVGVFHPATGMLVYVINLTIDAAPVAYRVLNGGSLKVSDIEVALVHLSGTVSNKYVKAAGASYGIYAYIRDLLKMFITPLERNRIGPNPFNNN